MLDGLDGKVGVVTGGGRGLGRAEAVELARQGVRVVVNDAGRTLEGVVEDNPAEAVAEEIRAAGGEATADQGDIADWDYTRGLIGRAVERYGRIDVFVNNAGFLRNRMPFKMSEDEWDDVIRVHLKGHFCTTRWALEHWRDRAKAGDGRVYGRIVNTASEAGLTGAVSQPNYAAAKGGIIQLTLSSARALAKYGVTANAIAPRALTRMTTHIDAFHAEPDGFQPFAPENVTPLVAYLASPAAARVTGQVFVVYGREIDLLAAPAIAEEFTIDTGWTPEAVDAALTPYFDQREPLDPSFAFAGRESASDADRTSA